MHPADRRTRDALLAPSRGSRSRRLPAGATMVAALVLASGCEPELNPSPTAPGADPDAALSEISSDHSFYYYSGRRILLRPDPGRFVVHTNRPDAGAPATEALAALDLTPASTRAVRQGHHVVEVSAMQEHTPREVARRLHDHPDISFASPIYRRVTRGTEVIPFNTLAVRFRDGADPGEIEALNRDMGTSVVGEPVPERGRRYHTLTYAETGERDPMAVAAAYAEHPLTEWADPNKRSEGRFFDGQNEPYFADQWYLDGASHSVNGVPVDLNVTPAWGSTRGGGITVAVLDNGIQNAHEDLGPIPCADFMKDEAGQLGADTILGEIKPADGDFHGTGVAGIIAGQHNDTGIAGIAPEVLVSSIRIGVGTAFASSADIALAIDTAWAEGGCGADVISNSWGGIDESAQVDAAIRAAAENGRGELGTPVVFAAGNGSSSVAYPANVTEAIAVSAIDSLGNLASFSNSGPEIFIAGLASGAGFCNGDIVTADLMGSGSGECDDGPGGDVNYTSTFGGTSAAAPQVAAAIALLLSAEPGLSESEVRDSLAQAADAWGDSDLFGAGKLNIGALVPSVDPPTVTIESPDDGAIFTEGDFVVFEGLAVDSQGDTLTGSSLVWESNIDGQIGTGESTFSSELSVGGHAIFLTATDAGGLSGTDQISITIEEQGSGGGGCPPPELKC